MEPWRLSLVEASRLIRTRELSPIDLTRSILDRIDAVEPAIGAFVTVTAERALAAAAAATAAIARGADRGPLHGIPYAVKDLIDTAGVRTSAGSRQWEDRVPETDGAAVAALERAGMILVGKTTTDEFAYGASTPQTRNPWDPAKVPGGSSGGSAAAVAAGMAAAALGTDTGGSIRIPSALCGVAGFKPTFGLVSRTGVAPLSRSLDHVGPITRTVADAALVASELVARDPRDPASVGGGLRPPLAGAARGLRVGLPRDRLTGRVQPGVAEATEAAGRMLADAGAELVPVTLPLDEAAEQTYYAIMRPEASAYHRQRLAETPELFTDTVRAALTRGMEVSAVDYIAAQRMRARIRDGWTDLMRDVDAVLMPTVPGTAVPPADPVYRWADGDEDAVPAYVRTNLIADLTGLPALSLPVGLDDAGLPIGAQLVGRAFQDAEVLALGLALEERAAFGGLPRGELVA